MKILILTSKDHLYAHVVLNGLFRSRVFEDDTIHVCEQKGLLPGKSFIRGLLKYIKVSGLRYVVGQSCKQYLFLWMRLTAEKQNKMTSVWFPYWKHRVPPERRMTTTTKAVEAAQPDIILSIFSKEVLTPEVLQVPQFGALNIHPSLLPEYRGVSPTFWVLAEKGGQAGCTLHMMNRGIDTGSLIDQQVIPIDGIRTEHELYMHCAEVGISMFIKAMRVLRDENTLPIRAQKKNGEYRSLPTREAVRQFFRNGYRFFLVKEFHRDSEAMR